VGILLAIAFAGSMAWIILGWPLPFRLGLALLLLAGGSATVLIGMFTRQLPAHWSRGLAAGAVVITLTAAVLAIPFGQNKTSSASGQRPQATPETSGPATPSAGFASSSPSEPDPLAVTLDLKELSCENYTIPKSFLSSLPKIATGYDAEWIYKNGGATLSHAAIYVQGMSQDAVIVQRIRVIDVHKHASPSDVIGVFSCGPEGGAVATRRLQVNMDHPTKVRSLPGEIDPDGTRQPAHRFPFKVSNSEPEVFLLEVTGSPCFCEWRIAVDWTSAGRTGTTVVDRNFGSIRSDTSDYKDRQMYYLYDGEWMQS